MSGLSSSQAAYQATLVQQAATLAGSIQTQGAQAPAQAPPGASTFQQEAIGLEAQVAGTLAASISGAGTPPPEPLTAPGTNPYQSSYDTAVLNQTSTLLGSLGIGTQTNASA
jgi:hypothetical protein